MNKNDFKLIFILLLICIILFLIFYKNDDGEIANVYYENNLILKIDLSKNDEYIVEGYNGDVKLKVEDKKIKVIEETSPLHICAKQGYISSVNQVLVCLPNKIIVKIENDEMLDTVIG